MEKVRVDKLREVTDGCDGTWIAHPGLVPIAREVFDKHMPGPNQYGKQLPEVQVGAKDLLDFRPEGPITEAGLRNNVQVGIQYIGSWLGGNGCVPIFNLMEDAATAEISRSQVWQWIRSPKGVLDDGRKVTRALFHEILVDELAKTPAIVGEEAFAAGKYAEGAKLFEEITASDDYVEFLTLPAYDALA
jgi:malate synthase